ncbi:MAG: hypothetical protein K6U10_06035 [Acidobacteriia bacterium]|nr:hypothetical protein [Methyloceanibacter sp.]MBX5472208.1 hypothetical protein [Acetobacteraceae bacterium]MCL6491363.1 hypothetical protein [Terriglobia bacterium]
MAEQTLYLDGGGAAGPLAILVEGPALRIRAQGAADVFAPLSRLARVVSTGPVHWRIEALELCMIWGVPISFLDGRGRALGACVPLYRPAWKSDLPALLEAAADRPDWPERLENWLRGTERREMLRLARRYDLRPRDWRGAALHSLCEARAALQGAALEGILRELQGLHEAELLAMFARLGVGPRFLALRLGGANLAVDLAHALRWARWPIAWRLSAYLREHGAKHDKAALRRRIVRFYEAEAPRFAKLHRLTVARLAAMLAETAE